MSSAKVPVVKNRPEMHLTKLATKVKLFLALKQQTQNQTITDEITKLCHNICFHKTSNYYG